MELRKVNCGDASVHYLRVKECICAYVRISYCTHVCMTAPGVYVCVCMHCLVSYGAAYREM